MTIRKFLESKRIHWLEIKGNFKLDKAVDMDFGRRSKHCAYCDDTKNNVILPSEPWTIVQYCYRCDHINLIFVSDRMGGNYTDVVECYTNIEKDANKTTD